MVRSAISPVLALTLVSCTAAPVLPGASEQPVAPNAQRKPDVRYDPSPPRVVRAMLELAEVNENDLVYDLGSGDGRIPITAARDFGARAVGIEIDPKLIALATENAQKAGVADRVQFRNEDLFEADISDATVVTLFLNPQANRRLRSKLFAELRPGVRVISHWHDMDDWQPDRTVQIERRPIYLWRIPRR